jgi:hypothetical protein
MKILLFTICRSAAIALLLMAVLLQCNKDKDGGNALSTDIDGDVLLKTQKAVDSFVQVYKKYINLTIKGNLVIGSQSTDINNISRLDKIKSVKGSLGIVQTSQLQTLTGLHNIPSVNALYIFLNTGLTNLNGLTSLKTIETFFYLESNDNMLNMGGLDNLELIKGDLKLTNGFFGGSMSYNQSLKVISLPKLKKIGGSFDLNNIKPITTLSFPLLDSIAGDLVISNAEHLTDFAGFGELKHIGGGLSIYQNSVESLTGFTNLKTIGGAFNLSSNSSITNMTGLPALREIGGYIQLSFNNNLLSLNGMELITTAASIHVDHNSKLSNLCAIKQLVQNILTRFPSSSPYQLVVLDDNAETLPDPYFHSHILSSCP